MYCIFLTTSTSLYFLFLPIFLLLTIIFYSIILGSLFKFIFWLMTFLTIKHKNLYTIILFWLFVFLASLVIPIYKNQFYISMMFSIFPTYSLYHFDEKKYEKYIFNIQYLIVLFICFFVSLCLYYESEVYRIKNETDTVVVSFKYNSNNISTNENISLIGQTKDFMFLYNKRDKSSLIYKVSNIDSLQIR